MKNFLNILVAVLLVACLPHPGYAVVPVCPADGTEVCFNCVTKGNCSEGAGNNSAAGIGCGPREACKVAAGVATCMPLSTVPECGCGGATVGCDAYDGDAKIFCVPPGAGRSVYVGENCANSNPNSTCVAGVCVAAATSSSCAGQTTPGFVLSKPTCTAGIFCNGVEKVYTQTCTAGQYFNEVRGACEAYPPNPCAGCTKLKCPIISDCTKYAVCRNGLVVDDDESCAANQVFNSGTGECEAGTDPVGICARYQGCVFGSSGSTVPTVTPSSSGASVGGEVGNPVPTLPPCTAANAGQRYPHENCERYYTCREVTRNSYRYLDSKCPTPLVFNRTVLKCDTRTNVPGCTPST